MFTFIHGIQLKSYDLSHLLSWPLRGNCVHNTSTVAVKQPVYLFPGLRDWTIRLLQYHFICVCVCACELVSY